MATNSRNPASEDPQAPLPEDAIAALGDDDAAERMLAAMQLGIIAPGAPEVDRALLRAARDPVREVRSAATESLVVRDPGRPIRPLLAAIRGVEDGAQEADAPLTVAEVLAYPGLARLESVDIAAVLLEGMRSADPDLRAEASWPLAETHDPRAAQALMGALSDPVPKVRVSAAEGLVYAGAEGRKDLIRVLERDLEPDVRRAAAEALGTIGGEDAIEALKVARSDRARVVRKAAKRALREQRLRRQLAVDPEAELGVFERGGKFYERAERRFGNRVAWPLFLLVVRPLQKLRFKIQDATSDWFGSNS
jgi:HEAT repeat-containing taxis protein